jgi:hypothetical protein
MKKILFPILLGCLCIPVFADREEREAERAGERVTEREIREAPPTIGSGTITEYAPGSTFIVRESGGPIRYRYGNSVTYVTRGGRTLSEDEIRSRVKVGIPVHVTYTDEGGDRVISRVELEGD